MDKLSNLGRVMATALLTMFAAAPVAARDFPLEWHWIRVTPSETKAWEVERGEKADVRFTPGGFIAKLYDEADPATGNPPDFILTGQVHGRQVTAVAVQPDTDSGRWTLRGTIVRSRTTLKNANNGWGEDRISLVAGSEFIGLSRSVRSGAPPGK